MIVFVEVIEKLAANGWTQYRLKKEGKIGSETIKRIRLNQSISTDTINTICELCDCQPSDVMRYEKEGS